MESDAATAPAKPDAWPKLGAESRFALVVEASPTALVLAGRSGRIELVNRLAERMFGYDRAALLGQKLELLLPPRFRDSHVALRNGFFSEMSTRMMGEGRDLYGLRRDGSEFPVEIGLNPIEIDGEAMVLAGIIDITARRQGEREREEQRAELVRSNAELEEFAYVASHDLKAPLRAITHLVQWITDDIETTATADTLENIALLRGRVARMQMLLDGLLTYARIGHHTRPVEDVDINEMVHEIIAMLAPPPGLAVTCEGLFPVLRTHRVPIQVVLENLIGNALKHHDRSEGRITLSARKADGVTEFRIADDGPGIAPQYHDRIFQIFQTLASRDDIESSGIGLAIVRKKVQTHGGRIWVESAPPVRGSTFCFTWKESAA
jgi:PAS domain S-box-containing protein